MSLLKTKSQRTRYGYPTVGLMSGRHIQFLTSTDIDRHHGNLLRSGSEQRRFEGYLSTIYWGHYSGQAGVARAARAMSKVKMARKGANFHYAGRIIKSMVRLLRRRKIADAITCATKLPQIGFAFASKLCAFAAPQLCGVIDSVIVAKFPRFGFQLQRGYIKTSKYNALRCAEYCKYISKWARFVNSHGSQLFWLDKNRTKHEWRAIDVERALYAA